MIDLTLSEVAKKLNAKHMGSDVTFRHVSIDTRTINPDELFIAIIGPNFDGHQFVQMAAEKGAVAAIVNKPVETSIPLLVVEDCGEALIQLAIIRRAQLNIPFLSVTGSCGKTTTKSMMASILSHCGFVHAGRKSFNNHYGVPLTILGINETHQYAVVEMGANHPDEIAQLTKIARPDVAALTMAAPVHLEGFVTIDGVAQAKGEIFQGLPENGMAVINQDDVYADYWKNLVADKRVRTFGLSANADFYTDDISIDEQSHPTFCLHTAEGEINLTLPLIGEHNVMNALAAAAATQAVGASLEAIKQGLETMTPVDKRMVKYVGKLGIEILDNSYNANPTGVDAALKVLSRNHKKKIFVLGEMGELGDMAVQYHRQLGKQALQYGVDKLYTVGDLTRHTVEVFGKGAEFFPEQQKLIDQLLNDIEPDVSILVKGSRSNRLENVVAALLDPKGSIV